MGRSYGWKLCGATGNIIEIQDDINAAVAERIHNAVAGLR
jgi:hypothetical protein